MYMTFDIEISKEIPEGCDDWKALRPLGISCAATYTHSGLCKLWHPPDNNGSAYPPSMSCLECIQMTEYLYQHHQQGYKIVTWNGLGFDFDILYEEVGDHETARSQIIELALNHVDIAFTMLCAKGYMIGLDTAAKGMNVKGKTEGMHGALAPAMWKQGRAAQEKVLEYVQQDVIATANVFRTISFNHYLEWTSRSGRRNRWYCGGDVLRVNEALNTPEPDTSWMDNPWARKKFTGWIAEALQE